MPIKIMLDAGHYGKYNRSPVVPAYYESEAMWDLHLRLQKELESYGFSVQTTRDKQEEDKEVFERGKLAKGCDLFLSLHSNAADAESVDRVVVFYAFDDANHASKLAKLLSDGIAELMQVETGRIATRESKEYPGREYYGVMRGARKVGVPLYYIVEHSFHTNRRSAEWLLDPANRARLAALEAAIIAAYYGYAKLTLRKGDVDGDGQITARDYLLLKKYVLETATLDDRQKWAADLNGDGRIDLKDYVLLKKQILEQ